MVHKLNQENRMAECTTSSGQRSQPCDAFQCGIYNGGSVLIKESFHQTIARERKRTERSGRPFLLMLVDVSIASSAEKCGKLLFGVIWALAGATRETDVIGWYKKDLVVGVVFTDVNAEDKALLLRVMLTRMSEALRNR